MDLTLNDYEIKVVKVWDSSFVLQQHNDKDDLLLVLSGTMYTQLNTQDREGVVLELNQLFIISEGRRTLSKNDRNLKRF